MLYLITHFSMFDKNGDGVLSIDEFATALASVHSMQQHAAIMKPRQDEQAKAFKTRMTESAKKAV